MDVNFLKEKNNDILFSTFPEKIKALQWHSYEVQGLENIKEITLLASSKTTKYQIFKYKNHAYGILFHIEIKNTTVNDWGCVPEYKSALENQLGKGALEKFDKEAKVNMKQILAEFDDNLQNSSKKLELILRKLNVPLSLNELKIEKKEWERIVSNAFVGERGKNFLGNKKAFDEVVNSSNFL